MTKSQSPVAGGLKGLVLASLAAAAVLLLAGCSAAQPTDTPLPPPTATPRPTTAPTATPTPQPLELVVLHTNDVMGFTEPCG